MYPQLSSSGQGVVLPTTGPPLSWLLSLLQDGLICHQNYVKSLHIVRGDFSIAPTSDWQQGSALSFSQREIPGDIPISLALVPLSQ